MAVKISYRRSLREIVQSSFVMAATCCVMYAQFGDDFIAAIPLNATDAVHQAALGAGGTSVGVEAVAVGAVGKAIGRVVSPSQSRWVDNVLFVWLRSLVTWLLRMMDVPPDVINDLHIHSTPLLVLWTTGLQLLMVPTVHPTVPGALVDLSWRGEGGDNLADRAGRGARGPFTELPALNPTK